MNDVKQGGGMMGGAQMRITEVERELIKRTFKGNEALLVLLRKIFLPEIDPNAPIGQVIDLWMTVKTDGLTPEEQLINLKARNQLISHVDQSLMQLNLIAKMETPNNGEVVAKMKADSTK